MEALTISLIVLFSVGFGFYLRDLLPDIITTGYKVPYLDIDIKPGSMMGVAYGVTEESYNRRWGINTTPQAPPVLSGSGVEAAVAQFGDQFSRVGKSIKKPDPLKEELRERRSNPIERD